jgi:hypothetical protein
MFGRGRFQNGVIITPKSQYVFDPTDHDKLAAFRNDIWPTIVRMNAFAPQHSRLFKEVRHPAHSIVSQPTNTTITKQMILVASPSKPFQYTSKGSIRRQVTLDLYTAEIEAVYASVEESTQTDIAAPVEWTPELARDFVRKVVHSVLNTPVSDQDDFFQHGCDRCVTFCYALILYDGPA